MKHSQDPSNSGEVRKGCQEVILNAVMLFFLPLVLTSALLSLTAATLFPFVLVLFFATILIGAFLSEGYVLVKAIFQSIFSIFKKKSVENESNYKYVPKPYSWTYAIVGLVIFGLAAFLFRDGAPSTGDQTHYIFIIFGFGYGALIAWFVFKGYINPSKWDW